MAETVRAAVLYGEGDIGMRDLPMPEIGEGDAVVRVELCGVCGADVSPYQGHFMDGFFQPPLVLGHEIVGVIDRIGAVASERHGVKEGDRVVLEEPLPCGTCRFCRMGRYQMCPAPRFGAKTIDSAPSLWGGYAQYIFIPPEALLHRVPEGVPTHLAPLFVPVSNGIYWAGEMGGTKPGDVVLIEGPGQHGLGCVVGAREAGASMVIVTGLERDARRLELARRLGADLTVTVDEGPESAVEQVREATGGHLADVVVHVAEGSPAAFELAAELATECGTIVNAGSAHGPTTKFVPDIIWYKELTIKGVRGRYGPSIKAALDVIESGRYPLAELSTHTFGLEQTEWALKTLSGTGDADPIHVSIDPWLVGDGGNGHEGAAQ